MSALNRTPNDGHKYQGIIREFPFSSKFESCREDDPLKLLSLYLSPEKAPALVIGASYQDTAGLGSQFPSVIHLKYSLCCFRLMMFSPFLSLYIVT